ncbi:glycosyltransferase [Aeromonas caviae]
MNNVNISIAISTISDRLLKLNLNEFPNVEYIIVHQNYNDISPEDISIFSTRSDVKYIQLDKKGLSASRNVAISNCSGEYVFIMDDDVGFSFSNMLYIISMMKMDGTDVGTYYHKYTDGRSTQNTNKVKKLNRVSIAKPSSIDICFNRASCIKNNLYFDESFGLGTGYPSGEEMVFLSDCLKAGLVITRYPREVCEHPPITSGADFYSTRQKVIAKSAMFKRVYGKVGNLIFLLFVVKKLPLAYKSGYAWFFILNSLRCVFGKSL